MDIARLLKHIEKGHLSPVGIAEILHNLFHNSKMADASTVVESLTREVAERVHEVTRLYPTTELGWSVLPEHMPDFDFAQLNDRERQDVTDRQYQNHRPIVEKMRRMLEKKMAKSPLDQAYAEDQHVLRERG